MKNGNKTRFSPPSRRENAARTRSGVSLLISIVLISIVMVFAIGISNLVTSSLRQTSNVNRSTQAFYAAEGALESGLLENQTKGAGFTNPTRPVTLTSTCTQGQDCPTANVTIQGEVKDAVKYQYTGGSGSYSGMYGMPTPGTGTVGNNCNPLTAYYDKAFRYPDIATGGVAYAPWEHPCNWNKLKVGESVAIPLYTVTSSSPSNCDYDSYLGYSVCNPTKLGLSKLVLRVRTACLGDQEYCAPTNRYTLNSNLVGDAYSRFDDTILAWQITGTSLDHKTTYTLKPRTDYSIQPQYSRGIMNSEIFDSLINTMKTNTTDPASVLTGTKPGKDLFDVSGSIIDFLTNTSPFIRTDNNIINQPVLKLTLVHSLDSFSSATTSVPYLEYQLLTDNSILPPADTSQTITAEGVSGTFKQVLEVKQPQETGLLEYVIQQ